MNTCEIKCVAENGVKIPAYQTKGAAGCDVCAFLPNGEEIVLKVGERQMIPTGLKFAIPEGFEIQVRPRSGLAAKNGVTVLNTPGTIDSDYRGELIVALHNHSNEDQIISVNVYFCLIIRLSFFDMFCYTEISVNQFNVAVTKIGAVSVHKAVITSAYGFGTDSVARGKRDLHSVVGNKIMITSFHNLM